MTTQATEQIAKQYAAAAINKQQWGSIGYNAIVEGVIEGGVTDTTPQLQALVNKAIAAGRRTIFLPHITNGQYRVTALPGADQVVFVGDNCTFVGGYTGSINQLGGFAALKADSSKLPSKSGYGKSEKKIFDLRNSNEWDAVTASASFVKGKFSSNADNTLARAVRALQTLGSLNFCIQALVYWNGSNFNAQIGYTTAPEGELETANTQHRYLGFMSTSGFLWNDGTTITTLVPPANLTVGWYVMTFILRNTAGTSGELIASIQRENGSKAQTFMVGNLPPANNVAIQSNGLQDALKNVKYASDPSTTEKLVLPFMDQGTNYHTPIKMTLSGVNTIAHIPASYKDNVKSRVVIFAHGASGGADLLWTNDSHNSVLQALLDAGYVVIGTDCASITNWGNPQSVIDWQSMLIHYRNYLNIEERPYIYASSMGGATSLNSISHGAVKPRAYAGSSIVCNLSNMYNNGSGTFASQIQTAYGFSTPANFESATDGYDPLNDNSGNIFNGFPIKIWASPADTVVNKSQNADAFKTKVNAAGGNVSIVSVTGDHGDPSTFDPATIVAFFNTY